VRGPSNCACLLVNLLRAQDDDERYADIDSEQELKDTMLQHPPSEENDDLEWHYKLRSDKSDVLQFFRLCSCTSYMIN
jgi:hypothetical protein